MTSVFERFVRSEHSGAALLGTGTVLALVIANSPGAAVWAAFWHAPMGGLSLEAWVNDGLMAVFFLLIGLELRRELRVGALASLDRALLPAVAALGGMLVPAGIHLLLNAGTPTGRGFGIPMATDIAFSLAVLALLGRRVPPALRAFVVAFAVIDDLGAIVVIALFYSGALSLPHLAGAVALCLGLLALDRFGRVRAVTPYLLAGAVLWYLTLRSGVHATLAGVALAFVVPFRDVRAEQSTAERLEHALARPVALGVLPLFALANAGVTLAPAALPALLDTNGIGIFAGLVLGKPVGIALACVLATGVLRLALPAQVRWAHVVGAGMLGGIGFTMSIFITQLAFATDPTRIAASKLAVLLASITSAALGWLWLRQVGVDRSYPHPSE